MTVTPCQVNPFWKSSERSSLQWCSAATDKIRASQIGIWWSTVRSNAVWKANQVESATRKLSAHSNTVSRTCELFRLSFATRTRDSSPKVWAGRITSLYLSFLTSLRAERQRVHSRFPQHKQGCWYQGPTSLINSCIIHHVSNCENLRHFAYQVFLGDEALQHFFKVYRY